MVVGVQYPGGGGGFGVGVGGVSYREATNVSFVAMTAPAKASNGKRPRIIGARERYAG